MVALDVAVVVRPGNVGWIHVHEVDGPGFHLEDVAAQRTMVQAIVEYGLVVGRSRLEEVLLEAEPEVAPAVLVLLGVARDGEHAPRLALDAGAHQRGDGERAVLLGLGSAGEVCPDVVEEAKVLRA